MTFSDKPIRPHVQGKNVTGLAASQTAAMTLQIASGSITVYQDGLTHTFSPAASHVFVADSTYVTRCFLGIVTDDVTVELWVDAYLDDGLTTKGDPPAGFRLLQAVAWFDIAISETDLVNSTINRRTFVL